MEALKPSFAFIDVDVFQLLLARRQFHLIQEEQFPVQAGGVLWLGIFAKRRS
jgi:hypothetical protein